MRAALVACLLLGACGPGPVRVNADGGASPTTTMTEPAAATSWAVPDQDPGGVTLAGVALRAPQEPPTTTTVPEPTTVAPHPAPVAASRSRGAPNCGGWYDLVAAYDWPTDTACRILMCESEGDPDAVNASSGATGLFQILRGPTDPAENVALAHDMWTHRGWQPWVCR